MMTGTTSKLEVNRSNTYNILVSLSEQNEPWGNVNLNDNLVSLLDLIQSCSKR